MDPRDAADGEEEDRVAGRSLSQVVQTVEAVEQVGGTEDDSSESGDRGREYFFAFPHAQHLFESQIPPLTDSLGSTFGII